MSYKSEFGSNFELCNDVFIPEGFIDESWHNDAMPNFVNPDLKLRLWIDWLDPEMRDCEDEPRFFIEHVLIDEGCPAEHDINGENLSTDNFDEVLNFIASNSN
jgi:hypothetical protein